MFFFCESLCSGWERVSLRKEVVSYSIFIVLWAAIYAVSLSRPVMLDDTDTVHAEAVREMAQNGDWVTLTINNGVRYLEKAPLMYWLSAISVRLFGLYEWSVRLPVALFHLLLAFLLYGFGKRFWDKRVGFYAGVAYLTSIGPYAFTRILHPDVILTFFIASALYYYLQVALEPQGRVLRFGPLDLRCMAIYASAALAVLTKGLIGIIFVGAVIFVHLALSRQWDVLKRLQIPQGIALFLLIAAPWHLAAGLANPGFFWFYFVNEHFLRYLGLRYPNDWAAMPVWLFWLLLLAWLFPWVAFAGGLGRIVPKTLRPSSISERANLFLFIWLLLIMTFFSFSTTQEYYTFPALPAFFLILAQAVSWFASPEGAADRRKAMIGVGTMAICCVVAATGLVGVAWLGQSGGAIADLSETMVAAPDRYLITFGIMEEFTPATFARLTSIIYVTAIILIAFPAAAWWFGYKKRWSLAVATLCLMMIGFFGCYRSAMISFEPILTSKQFVPTIEERYHPGDRIVVNGIYEWSSSLNFYSGIQLSVLNGYFGNLWYGSYFPDAPKIFLDDAEFLDLWSSDKRVFFFSEARLLDDFMKKHPDFSYHLLYESGGKKLLVNREG